MKPALRVMLCDDAGERFFGEGPCRLLHLIEETGSLRSAASRSPRSGGAGGSTLTADARQFLERYEAYRDACVQTSRELYSAFFPGQR